jgi:hypothetical protein
MPPIDTSKACHEMATHPIRLEFFETRTNPWHETYAVPSQLITSAPYTEALQILFRDTSNAITAQYQAECNTRRAPLCMNCKSPSTKAVLCPMSGLDRLEDPNIGIAVIALCDRDVCQRDGPVKFLDMLTEKLGGVPPLNVAHMGCEVCGDDEGAAGMWEV